MPGKNYRNKPRSPFEVLAEKITKENIQELALWCGGFVAQEQDPIDSEKTYPALNVPTLTGAERVGEGDYLLKNPITGRFSTRSARSFEAVFEEKPNA